jgi:hypothetical protein
MSYERRFTRAFATIGAIAAIAIIAIGFYDDARPSVIARWPYSSPVALVLTFLGGLVMPDTPSRGVALFGFALATVCNAMYYAIFGALVGKLFDFASARAKK